MNTSRKRGLLASFGAIAVSAMLVLAGGAAAQAAPTIPTVPSPDERGTLNIHKFEQPDALGTPADGMERDTTGLVAMEGVEFTIKRVPSIDLSTNAGWIAAGNLTTAAAAAEVAGLTGTPLETDADGLARFADLPIGLYYVEETQWPSGATPAAPFLVTVPITNERPIVGTGTEAEPQFPARTTWLYDVHVYPKNAVTAGQKTVDDADSVKLGDTVEWTIRGDIPKADPIDAYRIVDALDARLQLVTSGAQAPALTLTGTTGVTLVAGDDYEWTNTAGRLQLDMTGPGLVKLVTAWKADATAQVQIVLNTTVIGLVAPGDGDVDGIIKNQATIFPNQAAIDWEPGDPGVPPTTTQPETRWGNIVLSKVAQGSNAPLVGAEFQVFLSEADALAQQNALVVTRDASGALIPDGQSVFTSDSNGRVLIPGLRYSTWANNAAVAEGDAGYQAYWVVETKSPVGADGTKYELLAKPVKVEVNSASTTVTTANGVIVNVPKNGGFELPLTGGTGTWLLTAGGLLLIGGALFLVLRRKRA